MNSCLWIPCYNEGTQEVRYTEPVTWRNCSEQRHNIHATLQLMRKRIQSGLFERVIITDDGSTDDTREGIDRFLRETSFPKSSFHILNGTENRGKIARFFEASYFAQEKGIDIFTMTDADMVYAPFETFERLKTMPESSCMGVSLQGEHCLNQYLVYGSETSGTRSIHLKNAKTEFARFGINSESFPGRGYGLEFFLNYFLGGRSREVNGKQEEHTIPCFLAPMRNGRGIEQLGDVKATAQAISLLVGELVTVPEKYGSLHSHITNEIGSLMNREQKRALRLGDIC